MFAPTCMWGTGDDGPWLRVSRSSADSTTGEVIPEGAAARARLSSTLPNVAVSPGSMRRVR